MSDADNDEADRDPQGSGAADDSSAGSDTPTGDTSPSEEELRRRRMQSDLDRERAARRQLEKQLAEAQASKPEPTSPEDIRAQIRAEVRREHEMERAAQALREEFPHAASLLNDPHSYDGPEAMRYAAQQRHQAIAAERAAIAEDVAKAVREEYGDRLAAAPAGGGNSPPSTSDKLTIAAVKAMPVKDLVNVSEDDLAKLARAAGE